MSGAKIIRGLEDAVAGNFASVTIEGQRWVRADAPETREPTGHVFECPDCGKDCADDTEPHAVDCERRSTAPETTQLANEQLWGRFVNHYWDSFEGEKQIVLKHIRAVLDYHIENFQASPSTARIAWQDDPSADERWNAGLDFGQQQLCKYLDVDPDDVTWDAATEELEGDVQAVIGNILRAKFGEDWGPSDGAIYAAVSRVGTTDAERDDLMRDIDVKLGDLAKPTISDLAEKLCVEFDGQEDAYFSLSEGEKKRWRKVARLAAKESTPTHSDAMSDVVPDDRYSTAIVWSDEDQTFLASTPELPGCIADGETKAEALRELADARAAWIGAATEIGKTIPGPTTLDNFPDGIATPAQPGDVRAEVAATVPAMVQAEIERIQRLFEKSSGDKEDLVSYARHVVSLRAALSAPSAAVKDEWQDISTAPKDGTRVLIADEDVWMAVARFWPCNSYWIEDAASGMKLNSPTHWRPIGPPVARNDRVPPQPNTELLAAEVGYWLGVTRDQIKAIIENHVGSWSDDDFAKHGTYGVDEAVDAIFKEIIARVPPASEGAK